MVLSDQTIDLGSPNNPFLAETQHGHLASYIYHGLGISRVGLLWGECQLRLATARRARRPTLKSSPQRGS